MREIKFRAYINNLKWVVPVLRINFDVETVEVDLSDGNGDLAEYNFDEVELMQYTGLKDKNDTEIYEGDYISIYQNIYETFSKGSLDNNDLEVWEEIVDSIDESGVVSFENGAFAVEEWQLNWFKENEIEVIGNALENKESLEVK